MIERLAGKFATLSGFKVLVSSEKYDKIGFDNTLFVLDFDRRLNTGDKLLAIVLIPPPTLTTGHQPFAFASQSISTF